MGAGSLMSAWGLSWGQSWGSAWGSVAASFSIGDRTFYATAPIRVDRHGARESTYLALPGIRAFFVDAVFEQSVPREFRSDLMPRWFVSGARHAILTTASDQREFGAEPIGRGFRSASTGRNFHS